MKLYKILGLLGYDPELPLFININLLFNWAFNVTFWELKSFRGKRNRISVHQIGGIVLKRVKETHKAVFSLRGGGSGRDRREIKIVCFIIKMKR